MNQNNKTKTTNPQQPQQQKPADDNKPKQPVQQENTKTDNQNGQQRNDNKKKKQNNPNQKEERTIKVVGKVDLDALNQRPANQNNGDRRDDNRQQDRERKRTQDRLSNDAVPKDDEIFAPKVHKITGPTIVGKIELHEEPKSNSSRRQSKKKRRRIGKEPVDILQKEDQRENGKGDNKNRQAKNGKKGGEEKKSERNENKNNEPRRNRDKKRRPEEIKKEITAEDIKKQIKETLAIQQSSGRKSQTSKHSHDKRAIIRERINEENKLAETQKKVLEITEFITANELSSLMDVPVNKIIETCFDLGTPISINSRLDAEMISILAEEFGFEVKFLNMLPSISCKSLLYFVPVK